MNLQKFTVQVAGETNAVIMHFIWGEEGGGTLNFNLYKKLPWLLTEVGENKVYSVVLLNEYREDSPQISLNSELVSKGLANSTGDR